MESFALPTNATFARIWSLYVPIEIILKELWCILLRMSRFWRRILGLSRIIMSKLSFDVWCDFEGISEGSLMSFYLMVWTCKHLIFSKLFYERFYSNSLNLQIYFMPWLDAISDSVSQIAISLYICWIDTVSPCNKPQRKQWIIVL